MNKLGIDLVMTFEGFSSKPYYCPAGKVTIGYGSTFYENGKPVTMQDAPITKERAYEILGHVLRDFEAQVKPLIKKPINENRLSALVSFAYNVGMGNFSRSTLLKKVNGNPDQPGIREEFYRWKYASVNGKQTVLAGLVRRRYAEANLYSL